MRWFATGIIALLLLLIAVLPMTPIGNGGPEALVRSDVPGVVGQIGKTLPPLFLQDLQGKPLRLADFRGHPLLLTFERSVDWSPFTKARLVELRNTFKDHPDLRIVWVMPDNQINAKALRFIDDLGLRQQITFGVDPGSASIDRLKIRLSDPEAMEEGVPHPTTYLIDYKGVVRLMDIRTDYHAWLDASLVAEAIAALP